MNVLIKLFNPRIQILGDNGANYSAVETYIPLFFHFRQQSITSEASTLEQKFEEIQWNSDAVTKLIRFYSETTIELHCNSSDGARIEVSLLEQFILDILFTSPVLYLV